MRTIAAALLAVALLVPAKIAMADEDAPWRAHYTDASFDDAVFELRLAIEGRGFVVDNVSHVADMLNRTAEDVGATRQIYENADVFQFCSAALSRKMMEANPMNIAFCPYGIFVVQETGSDKVLIGYRRMPAGPMQEVEVLLEEITREAAGVQ